MNVVESRELRKALLLASHAPKLHNDNIPHRKKVIKTAYKLYLTEKDRINQELQVFTFNNLCFIPDKFCT
jgi:hypothetical protein